MINKEMQKSIIQVAGAIVSFLIIIMFLFALYSLNVPKGVEGQSTITLFDFWEARSNGTELPPLMITIAITYTFTLVCAVLSTIFFIISIYWDNKKILNFAIGTLYSATLLSFIGTTCIAVSVRMVNESAPFLDLAYKSISMGISSIIIPLLCLALSILIIVLKYAIRIKDE